jgi:hypothetical protein
MDRAELSIARGHMGAKQAVADLTQVLRLDPKMAAKVHALRAAAYISN